MAVDARLAQHAGALQLLEVSEGGFHRLRLADHAQAAARGVALQFEQRDLRVAGAGEVGEEGRPVGVERGRDTVGGFALFGADRRRVAHRLPGALLAQLGAQALDQGLALVELAPDRPHVVAREASREQADREQHPAERTRAPPARRGEVQIDRSGGIGKQLHRACGSVAFIAAFLIPASFIPASTWPRRQPWGTTPL